MIGSVKDVDTRGPLFMPYVHFPAYYLILKGGRFEYSFANAPQQVAVYKNKQDLSPINYGHMWEKTNMAYGYDYFLVRSFLIVSKTPRKRHFC